MDGTLSPAINDERAVPAHGVSLREALRVWLRIALLSFGGPAGQIAVMHRIIVEEKRWISETRFLHALNYCMLLPGPEAIQLAIYIGWLLHKTWGGIVAGAFFLTPSVFILWALSYVYAAFGHVPWIAAIFYGLKPAVMAIVAVAVIRIGRKALKNEIMWTLAALAFIAIFFFHAPFPVIILGAGLIGLIGGRFWKEKFDVVGGHDDAVDESVLSDTAESPEHTRPSRGRAISSRLPPRSASCRRRTIRWGCAPAAKAAPHRRSRSWSTPSSMRSRTSASNTWTCR